MKKRLERWQQAAMEKIGAAEFTYCPEIVADNQKLKHDKGLYEEFYHITEKQVTALNAMAGFGEQIKTNVNVWEKTTIERGNNYKLIEGMKRFGEWQGTLDQSFRKLETNLYDKVTLRVKDFVKNDIADARATKKKWKKMRLAYDYAESKGSGEAKSIHEEYVKHEAHTEKVLAATLKSSEKTLIECVNLYWNVYYEFFRSGLSMMEQIKESLDSLQLTTTAQPTKPVTDISTRPKSKHNLFSNTTTATPSPSEKKEKRLSPVSSLPPPPLPPSEPQDTAPRNLAPPIWVPSTSTSTSSSSPRIAPPTHGTKIFGVPLEDLWYAEGNSLPKNLVEVFLHLEELGPSEEELFGKAGNSKNVANIQAGLDKGMGLNSCGAVGDTLSVATVLQTWLSALPEPLLTHASFNSFVDAADTPNYQTQFEKMRQSVGSLPPSNRLVLYFLSRACHAICSHCNTRYSVNAAKFANDLAIDISIILGPLVLCVPPQIADTLNEDATSHYYSCSVSLMKYLILNVDTLFPSGCDEIKAAEEIILKIAAPKKGKASAAQPTRSTPLTATSGVSTTAAVSGVSTTAAVSGVSTTAAVSGGNSPSAPPSATISGVAPAAKKWPEFAEPQKARNKITQLTGDIVACLDVLKLRASGITTPEDCSPLLQPIKTSMQHVQKVKSFLKKVPEIDKSQLQTGGTDKVQRVVAAIHVFTNEIQAILLEAAHESDLLLIEDKNVEPLIVVLQELKKILQC